ncbi:hypothetical protein CBR_g4435 [Chara braunii]|uniref:RING-CH-type domain-containing protein n=1 Tax=Chara braunii TaxID=69332 RepID=A0A388KHS6_CHABU|nr:hypothetical protein CBR_g4435 [Chara braunii]|eukprot:GBG69605.1 hypothetical protein CBR_g4435 [Chara braunii]
MMREGWAGIPTSIRSLPSAMTAFSSVPGAGSGRDANLYHEREDGERNEMDRIATEEEEEEEEVMMMMMRVSEVEEEPVVASGSRPPSQATDSPSSSSREESEKEVVLLIEECRICKEGGGGEMIKPCECGGTMARVHLKCLQQWISRRRHVNISEAGRCEICKSDYKLRIKEEFECSVARLCSFASLSFYAEFITILVTLTAMVALLFLFFKSRQNATKVTLYVAVVMGLSVLALGCFTLIKVSVRWRRANSVPVITPLSPARLLPHDPA